jgi:hypothetical protein
MVCNTVTFYGKELLAPLPNPKLLRSQANPKLLATTAISMFIVIYISILFSLVTSSCSLSPVVTQGTSFPFPDLSIVNIFLRKTGLSPNREVFTMRFNNLTHCIFKTTVQNACRFSNNATVNKQIYIINETHFKATNQQYIKKLRYACACAKLIPRWRAADSCQKVLRETEN